MGLFGEKLLISLTAVTTPDGKLELQIEKIERKTPYLLPFSCISLVGNQLTRLTSPHVRSLAQSLLDFIHNPETVYKESGILDGFELELYRNNNYLLYTRFNPRVSADHPSAEANRLQADIVHAITNFVVAVYDGAGEDDRTRLLYFLLLTIGFYQQEVFPIIDKINNMKNLRKSIRNRKKLAGTELDILNTMYHSWKNPVRIPPGSAAFIEKLAEAKKFNAYLP